MNDLKLSEAQSRYFGDLFLCCCDKNETSDWVSYEQATELFRSANLSADLVRQVAMRIINQLSYSILTPSYLPDPPHCPNRRWSDSDLSATVLQLS